MKVTEGYMSYLGYRTYYRVVGEKTEGKAPIVFVHGGPGSTHNYFEVLDELAVEGRQLVMYDQIGCGLSYVANEPTLWTAENWVNELIALRDHLDLDEMHLLGQSWGGMLAIQYMCDHFPKGIKSLILSSTLSSSKLWGEEQHRLIRYLPKEYQDAIEEAEASQQFSGHLYEQANTAFMSRHAGDVPTSLSPEPLSRAKKVGKESYEVAWGPNEFTPIGQLKTFDYTNQLQRIDVPTLITSGSDDLCTPLVAKTMYDRIPQATWQLFSKSRHMPFVDETSLYLEVLSSWLTSHD